MNVTNKVVLRASREDRAMMENHQSQDLNLMKLNCSASSRNSKTQQFRISEIVLKKRLQHLNPA